MTLDEAIAHAKEVGITMACDNSTYIYGREQLQLAKWLEELKLYRKHYKLPTENSLYNE